MAHRGNPERGKGDYFCVEASKDPKAPEYSVERYFATFEQAFARAEELLVGFNCVVMSEWGEYRAGGGKPKRGLVYFWWSDKCGWPDKPAVRGIGYPVGCETLVDYRRLVDDQDDDDANDDDDDDDGNPDKD